MQHTQIQELHCIEVIICKCSETHHGFKCKVINVEFFSRDLYFYGGLDNPLETMHNTLF